MGSPTFTPTHLTRGRLSYQDRGASAGDGRITASAVQSTTVTGGAVSLITGYGSLTSSGVFSVRTAVSGTKGVSGSLSLTTGATTSGSSGTMVLRTGSRPQGRAGRGGRRGGGGGLGQG